jgi:hypothetical protein
MTFDTRLAVSEYQRRGWALVPIAAGAKVPTIKEWQHRHYSRADFDLSGNLAGIFGARSGSLVDADLDCPEALTLADLYLPTTGAEFGRLSRPRSHRLYIAPGAVHETWADPAASGDMMVELRADGATGGAHMTLLPPSTTDGEQRQWHGDVIAPAAVDARALQRRMAWLAVGCLVMRYVSESAARRPAPDLPRLLWEFDHELGRPAYRWVGRPDPDAPQRYPRRRSELSESDLNLAEIVAAIPNDFGWEDWNKTGLAIYAASGGSGDGLVVFDDFSAKSPKYDPHAVEERWRNYRRSPPSRTGIGKLAALAHKAGWRPAK